MPTIGFFELLLISVVALLVLGPEKLPGAIRTTSLWVGRARRSFNKVKSEIEQQLNADEIRRQLHNESILDDLESAKKQARELADNTGKELRKLSEDVSGTMKQASELDSPAAEAAAEPVLDPATGLPIDEEQPEDTEQPAPIEKKAPVEDFYNNPGVGVIELRDGAFQPAESGGGADTDDTSEPVKK